MNSGHAHKTRFWYLLRGVLEIFAESTPLGIWAPLLYRTNVFSWFSPVVWNQATTTFYKLEGVHVQLRNLAIGVLS